MQRVSTNTRECTNEVQPMRPVFSLLRWFGRRPTAIGNRRPFRKPSLRLEILKHRLAPATFTVNTTADVVHPAGGALSLRDAITAVDAGSPSGLTAGEQKQITGSFG